VKTLLSSIRKTFLVSLGLLGAGLFALSPTTASATVYTFTQGSANDAVQSFSFTTSLSGAQLDNLAPGTDIIGSVAPFTFPVNFAATSDSAGFSIGVNYAVPIATLLIGTNGSGQITSWSISEAYFASYPVFGGENPLDFYALYVVTTTNTGDTVALIVDHDSGFAPGGYSTGTGSFGAVTVAPVPEPSTWAMLLLGFAGLGVMAYRRQSKPALMVG
jgi:hypothetical protein